MKPITLLVLYLQGSDAGQKWLNISSNFKFDVPLWLTPIRLDLVTTAYPVETPDSPVPISRLEI